MKTLRLRIVLLIALSALAIQAPRTARAEVVDRVIAVVNGEIITLSDFYTAVPIFLLLNGVPAGAVLTQENQHQIADQVTQTLIAQLLLDQYAEERSLSVSESDARSHLERQYRRSWDEIETQIEATGINIDDFVEFVRLEITKVQLMRFVTSGLVVSDAEVDAELNSRYPDGIVVVHYDVSQILLSPSRDATPEEVEAMREQAEDLRRQLDDGADFEALAEEYSEDPSRRRGGHLGEYTQGQLPDEFEDIALNLTPGEISDVEQTRFGFHIVRLNNKWEESSVDLEEVRTEIYNELAQEKAERELQRFLAQLHEDAMLQVLFDPASMF
ncbi:MAG: peptidylprolyl isomerase [Myxococcales bacterium]|nr:peptidylprolyl isomerase [Myxococcales bacterium]